MTPKNFTITYPDKAITSATPAANTGTSILRYGLGRPPVKRKLCSMSHSEAKPLEGGRPAHAITPTRVAQPTQGM
jgi:hypothetical protein